MESNMITDRSQTSFGTVFGLMATKYFARCTFQQASLHMLIYLDRKFWLLLGLENGYWLIMAQTSCIQREMEITFVEAYVDQDRREWSMELVEFTRKHMGRESLCTERATGKRYC
jgi:hypothetical protein